MSQLIATYDPNVPPAGQTGGSFVTNYLSSGIGTLVMWNNSDWEQDITFPNGDTDVLPAWTATKFLLQGPSGQVQWAQDTQLNSVNTPPISQVKVVAYRGNESVPGVYPVALVRQTNIANQVNANVTGSANIDNEGNPAGTSLIKSIVVGDGTNQAVSLTNDGVFVLGDTAHPGSLTTLGVLSLDGGKFTTDGAGHITKLLSILFGGAVSPINALGVLVAGDVLSVTNPSGGNWDVHLHPIGGGSVRFENASAFTPFVGSDGKLNAPNGINLALNGFKEVNSGSGTFTSGTHVVNHGLSNTPAIVMGVCSDSSSTGTFSIPDGSYTSTQFTILNGSGITLRISWLAYR